MRDFKRYFLATGLPYGLVLGWLTSTRPFFAWYDFAITVLVSALIFAGLFAAVAGAFTSAIHNRLIGKVALFVVLEGVAIIGGMPLFLLIREVPHGRWIRLPNTPEQAVALSGSTCWRSHLGDHSNGVVVIAASGHRFGRRTDEPSQFEWTRLSNTPSMADTGMSDCDRWPTSDYRTPPKAGRILSRLQIVNHGTDCLWHDHYIITEDHSIWSWGAGGCAIGWFITAFGMLAWIAIVAIGGFGIALEQWASAASPLPQP